jgi:N-methylhydantoinase B/oxoprolinase/acetone carboxylase alpha subunit
MTDESRIMARLDSISPIRVKAHSSKDAYKRVLDRIEQALRSECEDFEIEDVSSPFVDYTETGSVEAVEVIIRCDGKRFAFILDGTSETVYTFTIPDVMEV